MIRVQKIAIRIETHNHTKKILQSIAQMFPNGFKRVYIRKRNKPLITVLSGPHVHKKSRDQYKIEQRIIIAFIEVDDLLEIRSSLRQRLDSLRSIGVVEVPTYSYFTREVVSL